MEPSNGYLTLFKTGPGEGSSGGGGNTTGESSKSSDIIDENTQENVPGNSQDKTHDPKPFDFGDLPPPFIRLLNSPVELCAFLTGGVGVLNHLPNFTNQIKSEILTEAFNISKARVNIPRGVTKEAMPY